MSQLAKRKYNEIPIVTDVLKYNLFTYLSLKELVKILFTNKRWYKIVLQLINNHPNNFHNAVWEGPKLQYRIYINHFILPDNYDDCIFTGANLSGASLYKNNLIGANLSGTNLYCAHLERADLSASNLANVNLTGANLARAELYCANLTGANLTNVNLYSANLKYANLTNANLIGANLIQARFASTGLHGAKTRSLKFHEEYPETILVKCE